MMQYNINDLTDGRTMIRIYPKEDELTHLNVLKDGDAIYMWLLQEYLDPVIQRIEQDTNTAIAFATQTWQVGQKREDGMVEVAFIGKSHQMEV